MKFPPKSQKFSPTNFNFDTMKTTRKEYLENYARRQDLAFREQEARNAGNFEAAAVAHEERQVLINNYFNNLPTANVSFYIGCRRYFENVVKIGKAYFDNGAPMTKGRGYRDITEIEEITDNMKKQMLDDSYWY